MIQGVAPAGTIIASRFLHAPVPAVHFQGAMIVQLPCVAPVDSQVTLPGWSAVSLGSIRDVTSTDEHPTGGKRQLLNRPAVPHAPRCAA